MHQEILAHDAATNEPRTNEQTNQLNDESTSGGGRMQSRRQLLKALAATGGAAAITVLPGRWVRPVVEAGALPAHAQISPTPTATPTATVTVTPVPTPPLGNEFAIMGTASGGNQIVVFPTANTGLPNPTQYAVPGLPGGAEPHGVAYFGEAGGLAADAGNGRIFVVDLETSTLVDTITPATYNGRGTVAVAPGPGFALAGDNSSTLTVIAAPFGAGSTITSVALPGSIATYQTQAIVFDADGRAFVCHSAGVSVLDPPYDAIAFTIPFDNPRSGAIAITPDGSQLLTTDLTSGNVYVFTAPFSPSSTPDTLTIGTFAGSAPLPEEDGAAPFPSTGDVGPSQAYRLDGIMVTPDGSQAIVCNSSSPHVYAISAPFGGSSAFEEIPLPAGLTGGFEDVGISPDGQLAIVTGNGLGGQPAIFIQAPFTAAGATVHAVAVVGGGRGAGAVRFQPPNL